MDGRVNGKPLEPAVGHPPSEHGARSLAHVRKFLAASAAPLVEALERDCPDTAFAVEADGRLAKPLYNLKLAMQQASAAAGLYCPHLDPPDGLGLSLVDCMYLQEEVFRHGLRGQQWMLAWTEGPSPLVAYWSPEARDRHLPDFLAGRTNVCFALTEPEAGSDFPSLTTSARPDTDGWIISGEKHLITGAPQAELAQVFVRLEGAGRGELTAFLVPLETDGVERGPVQQTIMADGQTGSLLFTDVRVPHSALIGTEGGAQQLAFAWINWARTRRAGMCSGLASFALQQALNFAHERRAFGRSIAELGTVATMLSDSYMDWIAMRSLSLELLARLDRSGYRGGTVSAADRRDISVLKTWNDEALFRVVDRAMQVHGGRGLLSETGLEKILRVARNLRVPAGTTEIQRAMIAESLGQKSTGV
ncbi:MAG: acyl-CoA dehydrogenase [Actinomycetia bacterium]|nr:acyl-CoA dehydrogenase [Actinomycetes bacterium]